MIRLDPALGVAVTLGCIAAEVRVADADARLARKLDAAMAALPGGRLQDRPAIAATRAAYRALGKDPARYRPAAEALGRRVQQGKGLAAINTAVDCNNLLSLETGFSIGTYDRARLAPPLACRPGRPGESYDGIGRGPLNLEGLPVLVDAEGAFGSPTSDSMRTMVTTATTAILLVIFGFAPVPVEPAHLERARILLEAHCAARLLDCRLIENGSEVMV
jgi:DNA/RNA-binding domain of Phe-tRNA-synthetase-like protein